MTRTARRCLAVALLLSLGMLVPGRVSFAALKKSPNQNDFVGISDRCDGFQAGYLLAPDDVDPPAGSMYAEIPSGVSHVRLPCSITLTKAVSPQVGDPRRTPFASRPPPRSIAS